EAAMGERRAPGRARQKPRLAKAVGGRHGEKTDTPGDLAGRARDKPHGKRHAERREPRAPPLKGKDKDADKKRRARGRDEPLGGSQQIGPLPFQERSQRHEAEQRHDDGTEGHVEERRAEARKSVVYGTWSES